jgi:hypothetical protein
MECLSTLEKTSQITNGGLLDRSLEKMGFYPYYQNKFQMVKKAKYTK